MCETLLCERPSRTQVSVATLYLSQALCSEAIMATSPSLYIYAFILKMGEVTYPLSCIHNIIDGLLVSDPLCPTCSKPAKQQLAEL